MPAFLKTPTFLLVLLLWGSSVQAGVPVIRGNVVDPGGTPVVGATVSVYCDTALQVAGGTDEQGGFALKPGDFTGETVRLTVTSVGYVRYDETVALTATAAGIRICLQPAPVEVGGMEVRPEAESGPSVALLGHEAVAEAARASFVPSNPIGAIKQPQVIREGSAHSSRLRVSGTSPVYSINGIDIGRSPNHYGMFAVIPSAVVERMEVQTLGTGAAHEAPAAIGFETARPFGRHTDVELSVSAIEGTASWSLGGERWFVLGAMRKSILDQLVNRLDVDAGRRTVPPTNFQDIVASSGVRLGGTEFLIVDQYHVRDALEYRTGATSINSSGTHTALATSEHYAGMRVEMLRPGALIRLKVAVQSTDEAYAAEPVRTTQTATEPILDLHASGVATTAAADVTLTLGPCELAMGNQVRHVMNQRIDLTQRDWNFLPPDAASDNPHIYQPELNRLYGSYHGMRRRTDQAAYASLRWSAGPVKMETGVRGGHFGALAASEWIVFRQSATVGFGDDSRVTLFAGTFAEDPARRVLEAYQPLVHTDYNGLHPIRTALVSAEYVRGPVTVSAYRKRISHLPILTPDFSRVSETGTAETGFLRTRSTGSVNFAGGDIAISLERLLNERLELEASYGYSRALKTSAGVTVPYELSAPHRWYAGARYQVSRVAKVGAELAVRSGYAYTPLSGSVAAENADRYSTDYYLASLKEENRARFPMHATLNVHASFDFGSTEVYCSVANLTNRPNPIINGADGYVYDAGILPSVGVTVGW